MSNQFQFIVRKGPQVGQVFRLIQDVISIGRDPLSDIVIIDPEISRQHARLAKGIENYTIEDFGSTNGTFINGVRLAPNKPTELIPGQLISMGSGVILLYNTVEDPIPAEPFDSSLSDQINTPNLAQLEPHSIDLPPVAESVVSARPAAEAPLVPTSKRQRPQGRRRWVIILLLILIVVCLLVLISAYFIWGDPLMQALGFY